MQRFLFRDLKHPATVSSHPDIPFLIINYFEHRFDLFTVQRLDRLVYPVRIPAELQHYDPVLVQVRAHPYSSILVFEKSVNDRVIELLDPFERGDDTIAHYIYPQAIR